MATSLKTVLARLQSPLYKIPPREEGENALERLMALCIQGGGPYGGARNAVKALKREYAHWNEVRVARRYEVRDVLRARRVGNAEERAERIQEFLRRVFGLQNHLDLDWLYDATSERREKLLDALTMAPAHAGPVLDLDAALLDGDPVPPVTTDLRRLLARSGVLPSNPKDAQVAEALRPLCQGASLYPAYVALQVHARRICDSKHPRCRQCGILDLCPHGRRLLAADQFDAALRELGLKKGRAGKKGTKKTAAKKKTTKKGRAAETRKKTAAKKQKAAKKKSAKKGGARAAKKKSGGRKALAR